MWEVILKAFQSTPFAAVSALVAILALIISFRAYSFSKKSFKRTRTSTLYSDIEARYMDLLKLSINEPDFVDPALTNNYPKNFKDRKLLLAYEQYAFAAWNIVETIIDRREDGELQRTWDPVIKEENRLHRAWLNAKENQHKFKKEFWDFMLSNNKFFPCLSSEEGKEECSCKRCNDLRTFVKSKGETRIERRQSEQRQLDAPK